LTQHPESSGFPPLSWEQTRLLQHVVARSALPRFEEDDDSTGGGDDGLKPIDARYRQRARYFSQFSDCYALLGALAGELRLSIEPLHPLPDADHRAWVSARLRQLGVSDPDTDFGLSVLSRALLTAYNSVVPLFELVNAPADHDDLFLFDPLQGFVLWRDGGRVGSGWLGNQRDIFELERADPGVKALLLRSHSDHFCLGKSLLMRLIGPLMRRRWAITFDGADIPTVEVSSQLELEQLADDLRNACEAAPANISAVFRGQTREYLLPDREALVSAAVFLYSDVRDHSVVPSLYRHSDRFLNDPAHFRAFASHLLDWMLCSDLVFGDPVRYASMDGEPYVPRQLPPDATATMTLHLAGQSGGLRALEDLGPYTIWRVTDADGAVLDEYVKYHRPGHDSVRRHLILQHYGAPTPFVDVTHDVRIAEWFALHQISVQEDGLSSGGMVDPPYREPAIFVFLTLDGLVPIVDTGQLTTPEEALRPHRQACAVLGGAGNLYRNAASRFIALKIKFADAFRPANLPTARHLFPGPDEDPMLKRLLDQFEAHSATSRLFPVYWFPE
jgi:hypothetical protein